MLTRRILYYFGFCIVSINSQICNPTYENNDNTPGRCVSLIDCPPLLSILRSPIKTAQEIHLLQKLTCVADDNNPKACCAIKDITAQRTVQPSKIQSILQPSSGFIYPSDASPEYPLRTQIFSNPQLINESTTKQPNQEQSTLDEFETRKGNVIHKNFKLLPTLQTCGVPGAPERIIGGTDAPWGSFRYMARIGYKNVETGDVDFYCGGTVISKRYILSASHCTEEIDPEEYKPVIIRLGEYEDGKNPDCYSPDDDDSRKVCSYVQDYKIEKIIPHYKYSVDDKSNDIELIRVSKDIKFDENVQPICLPFYNEYGISEYMNASDLNKDKGIVTGWGRQRWNSAHGSKILQYVILPVLKNDDCEGRYNSKVKISDKQICASGVKDRDSCGGDSGGPLTFPLRLRTKRGQFHGKYFQAGIASYGPVQCSSGLPGIYTRVEKYKDWILNNLEE